MNWKEGVKTMARGTVAKELKKTLKDPRVLETKSNPFKKLRKMFKRFF
ncbi:MULTISPECIES: hypothetical protein [Bacillus amyloliquefaciens group]|nr:MULTISPECIES: hypothetical protein [Bacillus amyloliquefaciens group]EIF15246.1 hypothetical protein MY7_3610 [Bacillus sp. 5B6]